MSYSKAKGYFRGTGTQFGNLYYGHTCPHIIEGTESEAMALLDEVPQAGKNDRFRKNNASLMTKLDITLSKG
jgi:hypothetical protein